VQLALSGAKSKAQTARDLGITEHQLYAWIEQYGPEAAVPVDAQAEIRRLRKALARAEMERDILKKAIGIFSEAQR
jgi:transposase